MQLLCTNVMALKAISTITNMFSHYKHLKICLQHYGIQKWGVRLTTLKKNFFLPKKPLRSSFGFSNTSEAVLLSLQHQSHVSLPRHFLTNVVWNDKSIQKSKRSHTRNKHVHVTCTPKKRALNLSKCLEP